MLKPKYIEQLPAAMVELYSEVEQDILADMARRIAAYDYWIPAAEHQRKALIELGQLPQLCDKSAVRPDREDHRRAGAAHGRGGVKGAVL